MSINIIVLLESIDVLEYNYLVRIGVLSISVYAKYIIYYISDMSLTIVCNKLYLRLIVIQINDNPMTCTLL